MKKIFFVLVLFSCGEGHNYRNRTVVSLDTNVICIRHLHNLQQKGDTILIHGERYKLLD
jgi:hypothetical protein